MIKVEDKSCLKLGDIIYFHSWGVGGFLFGIVTDSDEDEVFFDKLKIWRKGNSYRIDEIDEVELIKVINDVKEYALYDFENIINNAKRENVYFNLED